MLLQASLQRRDDIASILPEPLGAEEDDDGDTTEVQVDLDSVDAEELIHLLTSDDGPSQLTILFHGSTCNFKQDDGSGSEGGSSQVLCMPIALNTAHIAFELHRRTMLATEARDTVREIAERFLQALLQIDVLEDCLRVENGWVSNTPSVELLIEFKPFKSTFGKVLLVYQPVTYDGFLESFRKMWENAPHLPILAGVLSYQTETILCLRVKVEPSLYTYLVFDSHARPDSNRGPAIMIHKSREDVARCLCDLWESLQNESLDETRQFSLHILIPNNIPPSPALINEPNDIPDFLNPMLLSVKDARPRQPQLVQPEVGILNHPLSLATTRPPLEVETKPQASTAAKQDPPQSPVRSLRNQASKTHGRLQSEFGWQLGLQPQTIVTPLAPPEPPTPTISQTQLNSLRDGADVESSSLSASQHVPESSNDLSMRNRDLKARRGLAKKDIGWQLALQEQVGGIKMPSKDELLQKDLTAAEPSSQHKSHNSIGGAASIHASHSGHNSSTTNLSQKSGQSGSKPPRSPLFESSRADHERQKPVRDDIGWQLGLAAKSLTFPMRQPPQSPSIGHGTTSNTSFNAVGLGAPNPPSPNLVTSEFGTLQDSDAKASSTLLSPEAPRKELDPDFGALDTVDCEYCFGPCVVDQLIVVGPEGQCEHMVCRDCIRRHILQELQACRFPILCPVCVLSNRFSTTRLDVKMMETVGFSDVEVEKYLKLEFQTLPVRVACPKCDTLKTISRADLLANKKLQCEAAFCFFQWCRGCHKEHVANEPHVCKDHRDRKDRVLRRKPGRHCPGCQAFVVRPKSENNHLECSSLCGLHFCFVCGEVIADTAKGHDVLRYEYLHYNQRQCIHFGNHKDEDCSIQ